MDLSHWREDYTKYNLKEASLPESPFVLFHTWFEKSIEDKSIEPNAMVLSTSNNNVPNARIVLLKEVLEDKFIFYTNYQSEKGLEIEANPQVHLLFFWAMSQRQVRIKGHASKISEEKSQTYFDSRPLESRISAIASPQSHRIDMESLLRRVEEVQSSSEIQCPTHWGGYQVVVSEFEFWQGQAGRLHDRMVYKKINNDKWEIYRLAP